MTEQIRLQVGDPAPDFTLTSSDAKQVTLSDFRGTSVIVYFYPRAATPGCTKQACDFTENLALLNDAGYEVLGISPDSPEKLARFVDDEQLRITLLSDPRKDVLTEWGAFGEKKNYGKVVQGVIRSTFVIDPDGKIAEARYNVKATGHVAKLIKELEIG